jgi:hypothetical protein
MTSITIELHSQGRKSCRLWSRFAPFHKCEVLDALLIQGRIILAITNEADSIELWSIDLSSDSLNVETPQPALWRALASGALGDVGCKLSFNQKADVVRAEITDRVSTGVQKTVLQQNSKAWTFTVAAQSVDGPGAAK